MHEETSQTPSTNTDTSASVRNKIGLGPLAATFAFLIGAIVVALRQDEKTLADRKSVV